MSGATPQAAPFRPATAAVHDDGGVNEGMQGRRLWPLSPDPRQRFNSGFFKGLYHIKHSLKKIFTRLLRAHGVD
jgi:hypothetical protein